MVLPAHKAFRCISSTSEFLVAVVLFCALISSAVPAKSAGPSHPDLSGTWALDAKRSDFGPLPVPGKMIDSIEQNGSEIRIKRALANDEGEAIHEFSYKFDGSEVVNKTSSNHTRSRAHWEGAVLVVETELEIEGLPLQILDRWKLDVACGCLQIARRFHSAQGEMHMRLFMVRNMETAGK